MLLIVQIWNFIPLMLHWIKQFSFINLPIWNWNVTLKKLIAGVNENFKKRNISLLEFIDYYDSYKETCIQLHEIKKRCFPRDGKPEYNYRAKYIKTTNIHKLSKTNELE